MKKLFLLLAAFLLANGLYATSLLSIGEGVLNYNQYPPFADRPVDLHYYIPASGKISKMPIVFVFEGGDRGYSYLLETWKEEADKHHFIVLIPHFDLKEYPLSSYQEVGVIHPQTKHVRPAEELTPALIDQMFEYIRTQIGGEQQGYMIYGHSAGGQFVQRSMLFHDSPYVQKAVIGSPGWYTFPDASLDFPYGVRNIPYITPEVIKKYLSKPIILQLATGDTIRESYLRKTPEAEEQGRNRHERGKKFYQYIHQVAAEQGWPCNWQKIEEQGVGHNSTEMGKRAVPFMVKDSLRALFIGNSYTNYNQLIRQVQQLASSTGHNLSVKMIEYGGWTLKKHAAHPETLEAIREGNWDFVILQEQSKAPAREKEWVQENVYRPAHSLDSLRRLYNPKGKTVFYMTWGHQIDTYAEMQQRLAGSYLEMSTTLDAWCAPVGIAWKRVRQESPHITLYDPDHSHPSRQGSYLAANVLCTVLFQQPYTSTYYAGLPEEEARCLQRVAQETVLSNLSLWNINPPIQPERVAHRFYPDPSNTYTTPTLSKPMEEGVASLDEITCYLQKLAVQHPEMMTFSSLGTTPQGREIPILQFGSPQEKRKIRVWIQAGLHGNEPAGTEASCLLTDYLLNNPEGNRLLKSISLALVPVANPDGYAKQTRRSGNGLDLNRDQSKLADPVTQLLKEAYTHWNPEIALDIHEFNPIRKEFEHIRQTATATANDVLFLPSGHLNISPQIRRLSNELFYQEARKALEEKDHTTGLYFTPSIRNDSLYAMLGAKSPQSSSTFQALTNAVSLFIEIRGIGLGSTSFARRTECGFQVALNLLETATLHSKDIKKSIQKSIKENQNKRDDLYVTFHPTQKELSFSFIDLDLNEQFTQRLPTFDSLELIPDLVRKRPKAYLLADTCRAQIEKLRTLGIEVEQMTKERSITVEKYIVTEHKQSAKEWEGIYPVTVSTRLVKEKRSFPAGSYLIRLSQKNANLVATLLEPESTNGFIHFQVIPASIEKELPIYRIPF